ncbi:hypothetical protein QAD02_011884 [Eretmocerus hayati]|uniref:Uncharacterized protein n=1 Tax=Eretmocerus hayati TaxID=131215 RepID=A0ACC2NZ17_9HYME|nr:hypothetical protein QAD02_011884 [Eretmocerus hayati]
MRCSHRQHLGANIDLPPPPPLIQSLILIYYYYIRGKYATVRRCVERSSGRQWAAKFLRKRRRAQELRAEALHEVAVLDAAAHCPRLVSLHQVFETNTDMVLVLELAPGGELQMVLDRDEIPEERQVAKLLRQILDGVAFLHSLNVAHLDIKPQNLVLTGEFPDCDVKLCDFGISRYISHGADIREILGTPDYIAPEVLNYEPISLATDMWSVGVLLYVLLTGCSPFGGDTKQETFCNISRCKLDFPDDLFEDVSEDAQDLIRKLVVKNPSERLSAIECLQHPWLSKFDKEEEILPCTAPTSPLSCSQDTEISLESSCNSSQNSIEEIPVSQIESPVAATATSYEYASTCTLTSSPSSSSCCSMSTSSSSPSPSTEQPLLQAITASTITVPESSDDNTSLSLTLSATNVNHAIEEETSAERIETVEDLETDENANPECFVTTVEREEVDKVETDNSRRMSCSLGDDEDDRNNNDSSANCTGMLFDESRSSGIGSSSEYVRRLLNATVPLTNSLSNSRQREHFGGLSSERRSNFKRSMDYLARKFSASADLLEAFDDVFSEMESSASSRRSSVNASSASEVFKCTPVFILGEEQQCSDSGSDSVSEISTDSSSDRSSIYSDDSLDFILYSKTSQGRASFPFSATESLTWKHHQRSSIAGSSISSSNSSSSASLRHGPRVWPRECNGVVSKALSRFTTFDHHAQHHVHHHHHQHLMSASSSNSSLNSSSGASCSGIANCKSPAASSNSSNSSITITSSSGTRTSTTRGITGLEALRNRGENLVVIREPVRAGRYMRYSEVQCESVQARIRRFQVHGSS